MCAVSAPWAYIRFDRYKFAKEYTEFGSQYQTLTRKYKLLKQIVELHNSSIKPKRNKGKSNANFCTICGKPIRKNSTYCGECSHFLQRKIIDRPTREYLKELIRTTSFLKIGKIYNVCDNTVRKWCIGYNLPFKKKEIKQYSDKEWFLI